MPTDTPLDPSTAAQTLAHASWAKTEDRAARVAPSHAALEQRFLDEADGDQALAAKLRKAHYLRLSTMGVLARRRKAAAKAVDQ